ncbi:NAD-binding protein [Nocardioides zhouii]|uniref:Portal protein n=1 Tax=Nocardioides zhouii TaxID=1168729 RepID=A0A4V1RNW5_9ACTN|nr:NAD-binding protein [Nocardioides zhouii]RYC07277.1 portal protein [Nocardioides zhouii]
MIEPRDLSLERALATEHPISWLAGELITGPLLVIGDTPVACRVCATLGALGADVQVAHLIAPSDADLATVLRDEYAHALVLIRDDVEALRYALALAHLKPTLPLIVTVFDRTIAEQLRLLLPRAAVVSSAEAAIPSLIGPCLGNGVVAEFTDYGDRIQVLWRPGSNTFEERPSSGRAVSPWRSLSRRFSVNPRHLDPGSRIMVKGLLGLAAILMLDWMWLALVAGHPPVVALSEASRVLATVGPGPQHAEGTYGIFSAAAMLATIVLTALFTAGLVDRFLEPRLVRFRGGGSVPRGGHVIVIGLGQVGVRLCERLQVLGQPMVAVERDRDASGIALARQLGIPVIVGDGKSRRLLERLRLNRCLAVAAVGSLDLDNVAVAVAASAVSSSTRIVMRAGEQEAVAETKSLLPLGVTRDVTAIGAAYVLARMIGTEPDVQVVAHRDEVHLRFGDGSYSPCALARRDECRHTQRMVSRSVDAGASAGDVAATRRGT